MVGVLRGRSGRIEVIAAAIAIFVFLTGITSLPQLLAAFPRPDVANIDERHPRDKAVPGYQACSAVNRSSLQTGEHNDHEFVLCKGLRYAVLGSGVEGCGDLDIEVYDPDGELIRADRTRGHEPAVFFDSRGSGSYRVRVINESCPAERCKYMVRMYVDRD